MALPSDRTSALLFWHAPRADAGPFTGLITPDHAGAGPVWGGVLDRSVIDEQLPVALPPGTPRVVVHSVALDAGAAGGDDAESSFAAWGPAGRAAFERACARVSGWAARAGVAVCVRPRAGGALSDIPSCLTFLKHNAGTPLRILLDPLDLLAPDMLTRAPEHLERIGSSLIGVPGLSAVVLPPPKDTSVILAASLRPLAALAIETGTPVIVPASAGVPWAQELGVA